MGTRATILLAAPSRESGEAMLGEAFAALHQVELLMSRYRAESDVGRLNAAPGRWSIVDPRTSEVLAAGLAVARASDGCFDPCLERLVSRWGFHDRRYPPRPPLGAGATAYTAPYRRLEREPARHGEPRFRLAEGDVGVDLGGIAKGYGIDRAVGHLRAMGVSDALVNVGDDLYAMGSHPSGGPWRIGVRHPRRAGEMLEVLQVREGAVATSGDYENYFERDGRRYPHLIDPHSGLPAPYHRSFTVVAATAMLADALATAGFTAPPAQARRMLRRLAPGPWLAVDAAGAVYRG
jgi:thiamine biosynthesis lipoprotein